VPFGVEIPEHVGEPADPPHVLFAGRLSEEKGILEFLEATEGLPRVIVGDGPLRDRVPEAVGFVPPSQMGAYYERASVVCVPSRREGYGVTAREALAYGRPVVATRVGGLADLEGDGVVLVEPRDRGALRGAVERFLADPTTSAPRRTAVEHYSLQTAASSLFGAYEAALRAT
jgi:glycosyltransferase involved in cell wall biosynthesis